MLFYAVLLVKEMESAQHGTVAAGAPQLGNTLIKTVGIGVAQEINPQRVADFFTFYRYIGVILSQICVVAAGINNAKGIAEGVNIKVYLFGYRL